MFALNSATQQIMGAYMYLVLNTAFKSAEVTMHSRSHAQEHHKAKREVVMLWMSAPRFALACAYSKSTSECVYCERHACMF